MSALVAGSTVLQLSSFCGDALFDEELSVTVIAFYIMLYYITETAGFSTGFFYFSKVFKQIFLILHRIKRMP